VQLAERHNAVAGKAAGLGLVKGVKKVFGR
jgi:hypothetical protein